MHKMAPRPDVRCIGPELGQFKQRSPSTKILRIKDSKFVRAPLPSHEEVGVTTTCLDLAVKLFGRYRHLPPSGYFYFCDGRVAFNTATAEIAIGNTVFEMDDFVDNVLARGSGRAVIARYITEILERQNRRRSA